MLRKPMAAIMGLVLVCGASSAGAVATYVYQGINFDMFQDTTPPDGSYDETMAVSGSFTISAPLAPNLEEFAVGATVFSFSDGRQTLDDGNSSLFVGGRVWTDGNGDIVEWLFSLTADADDFFTMRTLNLPGSLVVDRGTINCDPIECVDLGTNGDGAQVEDNPGTWTLIPEPATAGLLALGLAALGYRRRG